MAIIVYTPKIRPFVAHLFEGQEQPQPRKRVGTKDQRAAKAKVFQFKDRLRRPAFPHQRFPGRKCVSRGLGRNIKR